MNVERGRAAPPDGVLARLFPVSQVQGLPDVLFWKVLSFWRDPDDVEAFTLGNGDVVRVYD